MTENETDSRDVSLRGPPKGRIAWRTRSVLFTLGGGMATLWTLQAVGQSL